MPEDGPTGVRRRYRLHGFTLESELELPGLATGDRHGPAEVELRFGPVPERLMVVRDSGACFAAGPGEMLCWLPGVARFHVKAGREIVVEPAPGAAAETLRNLVLSMPLAALLLQRGLLPLHASAVAMPGGAAVFLGSAAAGKSTLAAALHQRGFVPVSDDITVVQVGDGVAPAVLPGYPMLRLWPEAVSRLGLKAGPALRPGCAKRFMPYAGDFPAGPLPVAAVFALEQREGTGPRVGMRLTGGEVMAALLDAVYRPAFARGMGLDRVTFAQAAALVKAVRVAPLVSVPGRFEPAGLARVVTEELAR